MNDINVNQLLAQMRGLAQAAQGTPPVQQTNESGLADFSSMLKTSIDKVNETQKASGALTNAFQRGEPGTDLAEVMLASQKASISFQAMVQVRNKLVNAYQDIMNMPI